MARCVNDVNIGVATEHSTNQSMPNGAENAQSGAQEAEVLRKADKVTEDAENTMRVEAYDAINAAMSEADDIPAAVDGKTRKSINKLAREFYAAVNKSYSDDRIAGLQKILDWANGLTVNNRSWWLHWSANMAKKFVNAAAKFGEWAQLYASEGNNPLLNQDLISELFHMRSVINGHAERLSDFVKPFDDMANEIAKTIGRVRDKNEIRRLLGQYAIARHILNDHANEALIAHWERELALERAKEMPEAKKIADLELAIDMLRDNLDNPNPPDNIKSVGYTDAEARQLMDDILSNGISKEQAEAAADLLVEANAKLLQEEIANGRIAPEVMEAIDRNGFKQYVPVLSRASNAEGFVNENGPYNPGSYIARDGKTDIPDDAFTSTIQRARRVAGHLGTRDFADRMMVLAEQNKGRVGTAEDNGLRIVPYAQVLQPPSQVPGSSYISQWGFRARNSGGFLVDRPVIENGQVVRTEKHFVYFDPNWRGRNGLTGAELNESMMLRHQSSAAEQIAARATSAWGQLFTRFNPYFGIANAGRDTFERATHMATRDYVREDGSIVAGHTLLGRYAANSMHLFKLLRLKRGMDLDTQLGQYWQEYIKFGGHQDATWGKLEGRKNLLTEEDIAQNANRFLSKESAGLKEVVARAGENKNKLLHAIDEFNDYWNNAAPFAHYITLREAGVPAERAVRNILDSMDFGQQGQWTGPLRMFYPFVKPIAQSAAAMSRALGLSYDPRGFLKPSLKGAAVTAAITGGIWAAKGALTEMMGYDEDGNPRIDQLSLSKLSRGIPLGFGDGSFFFLNTGYGLPKLASMLAWGMDRVDRGILTPEDLAGNLFTSFLQEVTPGNWPEFHFSDNPGKYIMMAFMPTLLLPIAENVMNMNTFGSPIKRGSAPEYMAKADYGGGSSLRVYNQWAQAIRKLTGIDMYPEQLQHLVDSYLAGPMKILKAVWEDGDPSYKQSEHYKATHLEPWAEFLGLTMSFGYADDVARSLFGQAERKLIGIIKDNGIKKSSNTAYKKTDTEAKKEWWANQCSEAGLDSATTEDIIRYFEAVDALSKGKKEINDYLRNGILSGIAYEELQPMMDEVTAGRRAIYREFVNNLNMYKR